MSIYVCPFCHSGIRKGGSCTICGEWFKNIPEEVFSPYGLDPKLTVRWADNTWTPSASEFTIGQMPGENGLQLDDPAISGKHVRVFVEENVWKKKYLVKQNIYKRLSKNLREHTSSGIRNI